MKDLIGSKQSKGVTTTYDGGGWFLIYILFGVYLIGLLIDYFWNFLVLYLTLRKLPNNQSSISLAKTISTGRKHIYCVIVTILGLIIDWLYYELIWGVLVVGSLHVSPVFPMPGVNPPLEFATILIPMLVLMAVNYGISRAYLHLKSRQAVVLGVVMGFFTAPWLIVVAVLYMM